MKKTLLWLLGIVVVASVFGTFFGKGTSHQSTNSSTGSTVSGEIEYIVGSPTNSTTTVYGVVVASNLASITTSMPGVISSLQCQPGRSVKKGDLIAVVTPANDLQKENSLIQQSYLQQQVQLGQAGLQSTLNNLDIQSLSLQNQKKVNEDQIAILQANLLNLQNQKELSSSDIALQTQNAKVTLNNLKEQYKADIAKIDTSIKNQEKSLQNTITNALTLFDQTFGVTNPSQVMHADAYLGAFNESGKSTLKGEFAALKSRNESFPSLDNGAARQFMTDATDFFSLAVQVIVDSIADDTYLPRAKLDSLYKSFVDTANGLLAGKSSFDTLVSSYDTTNLTYNSQIATAQTNLDSLTSNKSAISDISLDSQINQIKSQINSANLAIRAVDDQIRSLGNNKNIQTQQAASQLLTNKQSLAVLQNNLQGESLFAPFDGVVRSVNVQTSNKVQANALICQITPTNTDSVKIQVFSSRQIPLGTTALFYDNNDTLVSSGPIMLELPYKDALTQNYMYEYYDRLFALKEGSKVKVVFDQPIGTDEVWIPLSYVTPKLEGYFVKKKTEDGVEEVSVDVGDIDNGNIQILSGLTQGDTVMKQ